MRVFTELFKKQKTDIKKKTCKDGSLKTENGVWEDREQVGIESLDHF